MNGNSRNNLISLVTSLFLLTLMALGAILWYQISDNEKRIIKIEIEIAIIQDRLGKHIREAPGR